MITSREVVIRCRVNRGELEQWIERSWVRPIRADRGWRFSDVDLARIEMICDLIHDLDIAPDAIDVILPLIDQVHALRRTVRDMSEAIDVLPADTRDAVLDRLTALRRK